MQPQDVLCLCNGKSLLLLWLLSCSSLVVVERDSGKCRKSSQGKSRGKLICVNVYVKYKHFTPWTWLIYDIVSNSTCAAPEDLWMTVHIHTSFSNLNRSFKQGLKCFALVLYSIRSAPNRMTGLSAYKVLYWCPQAHCWHLTELSWYGQKNPWCANLNQHSDYLKWCLGLILSWCWYTDIFTD